MHACSTPHYEPFIPHQSSSGDNSPINLILDLIGCIAHVDTRIRITRAHLCLRALEGREELAMHQRRFREFEFLSDVAREPEIRILVDCAGDQAGDLVDLGCFDTWSAAGEDVREGGREGGCGLDGCKVDFANVVSAHSETLEYRCKREKHTNR